MAALSRMIITCPSCSSRYPVDATSFAPSGRKVRCAKCGNTWHQAPPSDLGGDADEDGRKGKTPVPAIASEDANAVRPAPIGQKPLFNSGAAKQKPVEPEVAPAAPVLALAVVTPADALDDDDIIFAPVETSASKPVDAAETPVKLYDVKSAQVQTGGAMRRYLNDVASMRRGRVFGAIGWIALTLFVAGTLYGAVEYRRDIAAFWPSTIRLYEAAGAPINLVGFELAQVTYERQDENGLPVLAVKGEVLNISGETRRVPRLRVGLRDEKQQELYHWTFALTESELKADGKASFTTRLSSPPPAARDLEVRFVEPGEEPAAETSGNSEVQPTEETIVNGPVSDEVPTDEASHEPANEMTPLEGGDVHVEQPAPEAPEPTASDHPSDPRQP